MTINKYKTFSVLIYSYINTSGIGKTRNCMETRRPKGNTTPEGRSVFIQFRVFPTSTSVDITIYQYGKNVLYFFYNIAMSKSRRIRKISVFTSGRKFPVLTLSYINTGLSQSAFRIYKCYIIISLQSTRKYISQNPTDVVLFIYLFKSIYWTMSKR